MVLLEQSPRPRINLVNRGRNILFQAIWRILKTEAPTIYLNH
jgi:hypothetical protein